jgi:riboflavin synthase
VNLERALKAGDRFGGHFVAGHVDGVGRVARIRPEGRDRVLRVTCAPGLSGDMTVKGSVALDGVSLTLTRVDADGFEVWLIPATIENTILRKLKPGDTVNIETDILAKYARTSATPPGDGGLTLEKLRNAGLA